jgi:hypothetical protein
MPVAALADRLLPDETIAWRGNPRPGFRFHWWDVPMTLFGLVFTAISLVFVVGAFPWGLLIPHFWVGLYFTFGRFIIERKIRESTSYAITDSRALIVRTWPTTKLTTVNLTTLQEIALVEHGDGTGTVSFGGPYTSPFMRAQSWGHRVPPAFEYIDDAHHVLELAHQPHRRRDTST